MCSGKGSAVGAEMAAIVFLLLSFFIAIGAMAGPYQILNVPAIPYSTTNPITGAITSKSCPELSVSYAATSLISVTGGQTSASTYAAFTCSPIADPVLCALYKNAEKNGNAAVRNVTGTACSVRVFSPLSLSHFLTHAP